MDEPFEELCVFLPPAPSIPGTVRVVLLFWVAIQADSRSPTPTNSFTMIWLLCCLVKEWLRAAVALITDDGYPARRPTVVCRWPAPVARGSASPLLLFARGCALSTCPT